MATMLEQLLAQLAAQNGGGPGLPPAAPSAPIPLIAPSAPMLGGPPGPAPELPPQAPLPPLDQGFVNTYSGPAPQAPAPLSRGQRIANALIGFGQGFQGNGPQFLAQLQEPQREYQRQVERYGERRAQGLEIAQRRRDREQELLQRRADEQNEREFRVWQQKTGVSDSMALEQMRQAHELEKEARRQRFETERDLEKEQRRREDDARTIAGRLGTGPGAAPAAIAKELGEYYANVRQSVSPAAAKWVNAQARRAELLARPAVGGGAASRRETLDLQRRTSQAAAGIAGLEKLARAAMETTEDKRPPILNQMRAMGATLQAQFPELLEVGEHNGWPYARLRLRGGAGSRQQQPQAKTISRSEMQQLGITDAEARAEGYAITP